MITYADISIDWLNEFLKLNDYDEQTKAIINLQSENQHWSSDGSAEPVLPILLTLAKCATYGVSRKDGLPPLTVWWLDQRTKPLRESVVAYLHKNQRLSTFKEQLDFCFQLTIAPTGNHNIASAFVINDKIGANRELALNAEEAKLVIETWLPDLAPQLVSCLSPLWNQAYSKVDMYSGETHTGVPVYTGILDLFAHDPAAQRMLVYLGHKPGHFDNEELHDLVDQLFDVDNVPAPWSLYADLGLTQEAMLQAERIREQGMDEFNINALQVQDQGP